MAQSRPCHLQQRPSQFFKLRYPASGAVRPKGGDFKSTKAKSCVSPHAALHCMESKSLSITSGSFRSNHAACLRSNSLKNSGSIHPKCALYSSSLCILSKSLHNPGNSEISIFVLNLTESLPHIFSAYWND